jgi:hypothetical protein
MRAMLPAAYPPSAAARAPGSGAKRARKRHSSSRNRRVGITPVATRKAHVFWASDGSLPNRPHTPLSAR